MKKHPAHKSVPAVGKQIAVMAAAALFTVTIASASQVNVTPSNMNGWSFGTSNPSGTGPGNSGDIGQMVSGPATPPLGSGSGQLATASGHGDDASFISTSTYNGMELANLTTFSYSTYVTANNGSQMPYVVLSVSTTGSGSADDLLFFEPPYQDGRSVNGLPVQDTIALNTWQSWNAQEGGWWDNLGNFGPSTQVNTLAAFLALYPNATIEDNPYTSGGIGFYVGWASAGNDFNGYVDNVTIGTSLGTTTYNFAPNSPSVPDSGASALLLGLSFLGLVVWRRRFPCAQAS